MKLNMFAYLYSKPLGNHSLKIRKKYLEIYFKNLEKSWKYHGILSVRKSGNPVGVKHLAAKAEIILFATKITFPFCTKILVVVCAATATPDTFSLDTIFTAHQRSCGKIIFSIVSVHQSVIILSTGDRGGGGPI